MLCHAGAPTRSPTLIPYPSARGPSSSTTETASWPGIRGKVERPRPVSTRAESEWQTVATFTRTRSSRPWGLGVGIWVIVRGWPSYFFVRIEGLIGVVDSGLEIELTSWQMAAFIVGGAILVECVAWSSVGRKIYVD